MRKGTCKFDAQTKRQIIRRIAEGDRMLRICADVGMPSDYTVRKWQADDPAFRTAVRSAKLKQEGSAAGRRARGS